MEMLLSYLVVLDVSGINLMDMQQKVLIHVITANNGTALYNDLHTFDANKASWTQIAIGNAPAARAGYSGKMTNG